MKTSSQRKEDAVESGINWAEVRRRISLYRPPAPKPPAQKPRKERTPEEVESYRKRERERNKSYRERNPDKVHAREKQWRHDNPDKVRAKKKRFYDAHKNDPAWMEAHRQKNREYKLRKRMEKLCYNAA